MLSAAQRFESAAARYEWSAALSCYTPLKDTLVRYKLEARRPLVPPTSDGLRKFSQKPNSHFLCGTPS